MKIIAGLDIGNGYVKGQVKGTSLTPIDIPSAVATITNTHDIKSTGAEIKTVIDDIYNHMDVSFDTSLVEDKSRKLFGQRAIATGVALDEFDIHSSRSKAKQELSFVLSLGTLAAKALQDYFTEHNKLPDETIKSSIRVALALPIVEFKAHRKAYAARFGEGTHVVSFHNFENIVRVELVFEDVQVLAEGASAQYAIVAKGEPLMKSMLQDLRTKGHDLKNIEAKHVLEATNTVGIDIGEGTVNFPIFTNGKFNPDSSFTLDKGYGSVLYAALERLQMEGFSFRSRKELTNYLQTPPTPLSEAVYVRVKRIVDEEAVAFAKETNRWFQKAADIAGMSNQVVYVYGGGATPVKSKLYDLLLESAKDATGGISCPILYLDSRYSRNLNREGLLHIADSYAKAVSKNK